MRRFKITSILIPLLALQAVAFAAEENQGEEKTKPPIRLDKENKTIEIDGRICIKDGPLELFACTEGGKEHEAVVALKGEPWQLHLSLILLGLKPGGGPEYQGDPTKPYGDTVIIEVQWEQDGKTIRKRAEDLIFDVKKEKPMQHIEWVFVGSRFERDQNGKNIYVANRDRSVATVYHDPYTVIDNPLEGGGDDTVYTVNTKVAPPRDTPVVVIMRPGTKPAEKED
ncbi:MAG: hypothetical protein HQ592_04200 [Planctomycetes bacterium]|nr:hypothetical protein [Planctomycetota bacterium]